MSTFSSSRRVFLRAKYRSLWFALIALRAIAACGTAATPNSNGTTPRGGTSGSSSNAGAGGAAQNGGAGTSNSIGGTAQAGSSAGGSGAGQAGATASGGAGAPNMRGYYSTNPAEFLGASRCAGLGAQICEDFESGTFDTATWQLHQSAAGDAPVIDALHAARGTKAAHFHAANNDFSYISETKTFPEPNDTFWGRMFFYIDLLPVTPAGAHFTLVEGTGTGDTSKVRVGGQYRKFGVGTDGGPSGDWTNIDQDPTQDTAKEVPEKTFVCLEWQYKGDTNETHFYLNGVEHPSLATSLTVVHGGNAGVQYHLPQFTSLWIGWWMYQAMPMPDHYDIWIDEIAIDGARIGCSL